MRMTREEAWSKMKSAFPNLPEDVFKHTALGANGLLMLLEALGLIQIVEPQTDTIELIEADRPDDT